MRQIERDELRELSLDELHRIHRTLVQRFAVIDDSNVLAIGFGGKVAGGRKQSQWRLCVRFHVRRKRLPRARSDRLPETVTVRFKRNHRFIEARFQTDVVPMGKIESTGCRVERDGAFCTGGCLVQISNHQGDSEFEMWALLIVGHAFQDTELPFDVTVRGRKNSFPDIRGKIRFRTRPGRYTAFDVALCEVTHHNAIIAGLVVPGNQQTPRGNLLIENDVEERRTGYLLREDRAGTGRFAMSDYFPELDIPQLGRLHCMVRAEAESSLFVGGTSGAAWCVKSRDNQLQPVAMQIAESENSTIGYGQTYFSILVEWVTQQFPNKRIRIQNVI